MSETAYLCAGPWPEGSPMEQRADFDAEQVVAVADDGTVPMLWLALFRADDLRDDATPHGPGATPLTDRDRGSANLAAAVPVLDRLFGPAAATHADLLRQALQWFPGDWLTVEWAGDDRPSPSALRAALAVFDDPAGDPAPLLRLCRLDPAALPDPHPPGTPLLPHLTAQAPGLRLLLGRSHHQMVPWEQPI